MSIKPKSLLEGVHPKTTLIVPKGNDDFESVGIHDSLVAAGVVPLRGNFNKLIAIMNALESVSFMLPTSAKIAIVVDDDNLEQSQVESLRQLAVDRHFEGHTLDDRTNLLIVSRANPGVFRQVFGRDAIFHRDSADEHQLIA